MKMSGEPKDNPGTEIAGRFVVELVKLREVNEHLTEVICRLGEEIANLREEAENFGRALEILDSRNQNNRGFSYAFANAYAQAVQELEEDREKEEDEDEDDGPDDGDSRVLDAEVGPPRR